MSNSFITFLDFANQSIGCPYVYGSTGRSCTPQNRRAQMRQYPAYAVNIARYCPVLSDKRTVCAGCPYVGRRAYDCAQLVRAAMKSIGQSFPSGATSQWKTLKLWYYQGPMTGLAANHPCIVFRQDEDNRSIMQHIGLSLGNGMVVDARSHRLGVIKTKISAYPWSHMAFPVGLPLPNQLMEATAKKAGLISAPASTSSSTSISSIIRPGMSGDKVKSIQQRLLALGFFLPRYGADGKYGQETAAAVIAFQLSNALQPSGAVDAATMVLLMGFNV